MFSLILGDDEHDVLTSGNKRAEPENGNFSFVLFIYACFSFVNNLIFCVTASFFSVY
jgi:hypothetical protein